LRFEQVIALGDLQISWIGSDEGEILASSEFDIPALEEFTEADENSEATESGAEGLNPQVEIESIENGEDDE
jgi:segregation and condensation protein A